MYSLYIFPSAPNSSEKYNINSNKLEVKQLFLLSD